MNDKQLMKARNEIMATQKIVRKIRARGSDAMLAPLTFRVINANAFVSKYHNGDTVPKRHLVRGYQAMKDQGIETVNENTILLPDELTVTENANLTQKIMDDMFDRRIASYVSDTKRQSRNPQVLDRIATDLMRDVLTKYLTDAETIKRLLFQNRLPLSRYRKLVVNALREQNARQKASSRVKVVAGNIFDSRADVLVNPTNPDGVMGGGLALQFSQRFPQMNHAYKQRAKAHKLQLGRVDWHEVHEDATTKYVANLHTMHLGQRATMEVVTDGLRDFVRTVNRLDSVKTVAVPVLGDGIGGLDTNEVLKVMKCELALVKADVTIYQFKPTAVDTQ